MSHQELLPLDWESVLKPSNVGLKLGKSKRLSRLEANGDTTSIQLSILDLLAGQPSYMPGFLAALKSLTSLHRLTFSSLTTPMQSASKTSALDSTTEGKVFSPYWNGFCQMMSEWLSLPTKTGFVGLDSIFSHGSAIAKSVKYWFSTKRTSVQNEKWLKTSLQSSTSSVADSTDCGNTKSKSLKTLTYQVYPGKELEAIWKKWTAACRKVYNLAIAYLNEHQAFTKVGKAGGKQGFRSAFKAMGLMPEWCKELGISHMLDNTLFEAYTAWSTSGKQGKWIGKGKNRKPNPLAGKKIAKFRSIRDQKITMQFDPGDYRAGHWMVSKTKHLPKADFKGYDFCVLTDKATELTWNKGRWFAHFVVEVDSTADHTQTSRIIALDPGIRTFMTGFDGNEFLEFGNGDFARIAKLCTHLDNLKSKHDLSKGKEFKRLRYKLRQAMERVRTKIKNLRSEIHKQVASYLAKNYDVIVLPTFETAQMVAKKSRKLHSKTARAMMTWAFYQFSQTLEHLCNRYGSKLVRVTEEYTSKTCTRCGHIHTKLGGNKHFKCPNCGYEIPRDFNGAVGIFLKALWDTTLISDCSEHHVVLDV